MRMTWFRKPGVRSPVRAEWGPPVSVASVVTTSGEGQILCERERNPIQILRFGVVEGIWNPPGRAAESYYGIGISGVSSSKINDTKLHVHCHVALTCSIICSFVVPVSDCRCVLRCYTELISSTFCVASKCAAMRYHVP